MQLPIGYEFPATVSLVLTEDELEELNMCLLVAQSRYQDEIQYEEDESIIRDRKERLRRIANIDHKLICSIWRGVSI